MLDICALHDCDKFYVVELIVSVIGAVSVMAEQYVIIAVWKP